MCQAVTMGGLSLQDFKELLGTPEPPALGPGARAGSWPEESGRLALNKQQPTPPQPTGVGRLIEALLLLWHDHLDAAHEISQEDHSPTGSFIHGVVHRREPDYGNARYWFRQVG